MKPTRRGFLRGVVGCALAPSLIARAEAERKVLVLVQLSGGNDGLNTVVPWSSPIYHNKRPNIGIKEDEVLKLDDRVGFHPSLVELKRFVDDGKLAVIEGVGYPDPVRSHFRSLDIWHTARATGRLSGPGWISRACDAAYPEDMSSERVVHVGVRQPYSLRSAMRPPVTLSRRDRYQLFGRASTKSALHELSQESNTVGGKRSERLSRIRSVMRDAERSSARIRGALASYEPSVEYPGGEFARSLGMVAATIAGNLGSRVLSVELDGFDTHGRQRQLHDPLLGDFDSSLGAFHRDLEQQGLLDSVVIMVFSEFGRRVKENASAGTDHGTAGPMFLLGGGVRGGLHGQAPKLTNLDEFDLGFTTDFRSVYSAVIDRCFGIAPETVLGAKYPVLDLFRPI